MIIEEYTLNHKFIKNLYMDNSKCIFVWIYLLLHQIIWDLNSEIYKYEEPVKGDYESLSRNELENRLHLFISNLLNSDFEKLCILIYRHDVSEIKFGNALKLPEIDEQAWRITHLVIDREMEKVKMRKAYKDFKAEQKRKSID